MSRISLGVTVVARASLPGVNDVDMIRSEAVLALCEVSKVRLRRLSQGMMCEL